MVNSKEIVNKIESSLNQALTALKELTSENFETNFELAYDRLDNARKLRSALNEDNLSDKVLIRLKKMNLTAKLIEKEYDNVVENCKTEIEEIAAAIKNVGKEKKIAIYTRG